MHPNALLKITSLTIPSGSHHFAVHKNKQKQNNPICTCGLADADEVGSSRGGQDGVLTNDQLGDLV